MRAERLHLLEQAATCFQQAGQYAEAARCRDKAGEPLAAADLFRTAGELSKAADCYRRAGRTANAVSCLVELGRPEDAAALWEAAGNRLEAAWILAIDARKPQRARHVLDDVSPTGPGEGLRLRITVALCAALERRSNELADVLRRAEEELASVTPASEQARVMQWAVQAADQLGRPDLAAQVFAAAYRCRLPGTTDHWREWARSALGGIAGIPEGDR
jgi:tetratricopeptide (TPR) repeat protein